MQAHASQTIATALLAGLMLIGSGALQAKAQDSPSAELIDPRVARFSEHLEADRERLRIPGLSAVILEDGEVHWTQGFGYADVEGRVPATPDTLYHIASVTKTFTAILVLQLVEQGKLDLDAPVSRYVPEIKDDRILVKHLLSHTSEATPGEQFSYNPDRFEYLKAILEQTTGKSLRTLFVEAFLDPLAMQDTVPGPDVVDDAQKWAVLGETNLERYRRAVARVAQPYTYYGDGETCVQPIRPRTSGRRPDCCPPSATWRSTTPPSIATRSSARRCRSARGHPSCQTPANRSRMVSAGTSPTTAARVWSGTSATGVPAFPRFT